MKRRLLAAFCAAALVLGLLLQAGAVNDSWDKNVIFLALNDTPVPLSDSTMPIKIGGTFYVPYFMFDANQNGGIWLGVFNGGQDKAKNTLTFFDSVPRNLTFDLRTGLSYDYYPDGNQQSPKAVIRNGQIYVSVNATARYFELQFLQDNIQFGNKSYPYLRIRTDHVSLDDATFKSSVTNTYLIQLQSYYKSTVGQSSVGESTPPTMEPPVTTSEIIDRRGVRVYLALRCETGAAGAAMLDTLSAAQEKALLLFPADALAGQDDLVRRAVGEGHMIGLLTDSTDPTAARDELKRGNELLSHIARTSTRVVGAADSAVAALLEEEGWLCWEENLSALPHGRASGTVYTQLARSLESRKNTARVTLDDSDTSSVVLRRLLRTLQEGQYDLRLPVETEL